jgi:sugar lactone lactonase YvrE
MTELRKLYAASLRLGESAIWHVASRRLLWIDLLQPRLFAHDPESGTTTVKNINLASKPGAIVATTNPVIDELTALSSDLAFLTKVIRIDVHPRAI